MLDQIRNGVFFPDNATALLEAQLFATMAARLESAGFKYLSVPSLLSRDTYVRQEVIPWEKVFRVSEDFALAGSAEQGILEMFKGKEMAPGLYYAKNQCFRSEPEYEGLKRLREFLKMEQFVFCHAGDWEKRFDLLMNNATGFLEEHGIKYRVMDVSNRDAGYHVLKYDIEVLTQTYGWLETHSCSYFGEEQTRRFDITGGVHTLSNTAIASPRILVPFLERCGKI